MGLYRLLKRLERRQRWQQRQPPQAQVRVASYTISSGAITLTGREPRQLAFITVEGSPAADDLDIDNTN
jgi:hypothetical protein